MKCSEVKVRSYALECSEVKVKVAQNKTTPVKYRYLKNLLKYSNEEVLLRYWPPLLSTHHHQHAWWSCTGPLLLPLPDAYKSLPRPPLGKSDHSSVLLLPAYRQKLKREAPALRTIQCWSDQSDAILQDCFDHVDWDMFRAASDDDIEAYSDTVTCFIRKCIEDVIPTKTIRIYPNQKPWINSDVRSALSARTSAFKSGNTDDRKQASYDLRRSIKAAKRQYKNKVEEQFNNNNPRSMWQGINNITGFKGNKPATVNIAASLPDELNTFYVRFEAHNTAHTECAPTAAAEEVSPLSLSVADVTRSFKRVNIRKAVGPDGIPGRVLKACAYQLAGVFYRHLQSVPLSVCGSLMLQKIHHCAHT